MAHVPGLTRDQPEAGACRLGEIVIHSHDRMPGGLEHGRCDDGAVPRAAVHPDLARGNLAEAGRQVRQRNMKRTVEVAVSPLQPAPHVQDGHWAMVTDSGQFGEARDGERCEWPAVRPVLRAAGRRAGQPVDADPGQVPLGRGDLLSRVTQQGQGRRPRNQPAEVVGEVAAVLEAEGSGDVPGGERAAAAQVDDPLTRRDARGQLRGVGHGGRRQVDEARPGRVGRAHVGVVRRVGVQSGQQFRHVLLLGQSQHGVDELLLADGEGGSRVLSGGGRSSGAEAAEPVRGTDRRIVGQFRGQSLGRRVLRSGQRCPVSRAEQVRPPRRAVQQRPAGEHRGHPAGDGLLQHVRQVREGVPRRGDHPDSYLIPDADGVAVADRYPVEGDLISAVHVVGRAGHPGQGQAATDVVVVDVRLEHVGDPDAAPGGGGEHPVDVPLRVHDQGPPPVGGQVAPVTQGRGVDADQLDHLYTPMGII